MTRPYRKRDPEGSRMRIIAAIGTILREKGYRYLYVNEIARVAEVGKQYIKKYFGGKNTLIKIYLMQKDYWLPHFEELKTQPPPPKEKLLPFYTDILQDQFRFFCETPELQKFILWQISEPNAIMRSISETREKEGLELLALAAEHFRGTGINFNAVVNIVLGGGYYSGLHAATGNSTVCGLDAGRERDKETLSRTMAQILEWAWKAAEEQRQKNA